MLPGARWVLGGCSGPYGAFWELLPPGLQQVQQMVHNCGPLEVQHWFLNRVSLPLSAWGAFVCETVVEVNRLFGIGGYAQPFHASLILAACVHLMRTRMHMHTRACTHTRGNVIYT